jgi:signal transduction histidine kinase/ligand-binding sensor domain-containing protein
MPRIAACIFFLLAAYISSHAQVQESTPQLFFKRISVDKGLSQATINDVCRDGKGFIWFATEDGLNRYDGNEFRVYRHVSGDTTSLSHNVVHFVQEDPAGNLWVGTVDGLNYFDRHTETFTTYNLPNRPGSIYLDAVTDTKRNRIWLAAGVGGVRYFDLTTRTIHDVQHPRLNTIAVWKIKQLGDSLLLGTLGSGLQLLNLKTNALATLADSTYNVRAITRTAGAIWFGTEGKGVGKIDRRTHAIQSFNSATGALNNDNVWAIVETKHHTLWVGTDGGGLNIIDTNGKNIQTCVYSEFDGRSISANTIRSIYMEPEGSAWLGTYNGGISYYAPLPILFRWYKKEFGNEQSLLNNSVTAIAEAPDGTVWIGTDGGGLHSFKNGIIHRIAVPATFNAKVVISLLADETGLWIGTFHEGLIHRNPQGQWKQYRHTRGDKTSLSDDIIWTLAKDPWGNLWVGTDRGVNKLDAARRTFYSLDNLPSGNIQKVFANGQVQSILFPSDSSLWVGSYGNLVVYQPAADSVFEIQANLPGVRNLRIKAMMQDGNSIWIGTYGNGLLRYDLKTRRLSALDEFNGLPNNVILSIEKEDNHNLWLSTNKGLVHFNLSDTVFTTFDANYGVQGIVFNRRASIQLRDGQYIFGGSNGFNVFTAEPFELNHADLHVAFTDLLLANNRVKPGSKLLPQSITEANAITLPYRDSHFISFTYSALHYVAPERIRYSYKIEGFDTAWISSVGHSLTFTNLDPGSYTLHVRASYNGRTWGPSATITIQVQTPWWRSLYFRLFALGAVLLLAYILYRYRVRWLQARKKELEHLVKEQSRAITDQNNHLAAQNEELLQQNEEVSAQKEMIAAQYVLLEETQQELQHINESLESQVQQRTEKLNETIVQLGKTIKELDAFVYSASHDLVAPLKSVLGLVDLARLENPSEELSLYLGHIEISVEKLENVIQSMIQHSRNTRFEITHESVNIHDLIQECIADVKFMPGAESVTFQVDIPPHHIVHSDPRRLKIIFDNLISNAIKYRDPDKSTNMIQLGFESDDTSWKLGIRDNGIGIQNKHLGRLFEMFFRATNRSQGSGLGLYIVHETINRLHGEIEVDSEFGAWTRFVVTIPHSESLSELTADVHEAPRP